MSDKAIKAGLVGLPNVGKSTLFNTLTNSSVPAENYPFCTIAPHLACTTVPDERLEILQKLYSSKRIIPATIQFVDIAGLVKGAAQGEGLGNQFLAHIRAVDLIIHVARCFQDADIVRTEEVDPLADIDIIMTELMLKDAESVTKRQAKIESLIKAARQKPQELAVLLKEQEVLAEIKAALDTGKPEKLAQFKDAPYIPHDLLISSKEFLIVANCSEQENALQKRHIEALKARFGNDRVIPIPVRLEHELSLLTPGEQEELRQFMDHTTSALKTLIKKSFEKLNLISFFTCGPQEIHAWPIQQGTAIRAAAGEIHSDLERGFICAEICAYQELVSLGSEAKAKGTGKLRIEGQEYIVNDGDIVHIKFNV